MIFLCKGRGDQKFGKKNPRILNIFPDKGGPLSRYPRPISPPMCKINKWIFLNKTFW